MKKIVLAVMGVMVVAGAYAGAPDWSKVPERKVKLFYPGQSSLEWVMNKADHSAVPDIVDKKRSCAKCHEGDANEIGDKIVAGKPVGSSKVSLEPKPPAGKAGWISVIGATWRCRTIRRRSSLMPAPGRPGQARGARPGRRAW